MRYKIEFKKSAEKFLDKQSKEVRKRILLAIFHLPKGDVQKMSGYSERFRLRVGNFRIIFDKSETQLTILVVQIGNRGDVYKH